MIVFYRRMPKFAYIKPGTLQEALAILGDGDQGRYLVYAGGTDLMPKLKKRGVKTPEAVLDLKGIPGLDNVDYDPAQGLSIGATASIAKVAGSQAVRENYPALAMGAGNIAATHIQNRGTVVGNICSALPSADSAPALLALDAQVDCAGPQGERSLPLSEFITGPSQTALLSGEIVTRLVLPSGLAGYQGIYYKLSPRQRMDLAVVGAAVVGKKEKGGLSDVRIALGAVAPTPIRAREAEAGLSGAEASPERIKQAAKTAAAEASPIDDHRASAEYRRMMIEVLVRRGLESLAA